MRISIFGGGIFGITTFLILRKKGLDCYLYEKEKELLSGATTKNLNRVHLGYHYPRDKETVFQSQKGFYSFTKLYSHSIIKKFDNHYAIAESSKVKSEKYEKFLKETKLKYVKISPKNFKFKTNYIENIYKVNEPVYSWDLLKKQIGNLIGKDKNRIFLKSRVKNIKLKIKPTKTITLSGRTDSLTKPVIPRSYKLKKLFFVWLMVLQEQWRSLIYFHF